MGIESVIDIERHIYVCRHVRGGETMTMVIHILHSRVELVLIQGDWISINLSSKAMDCKKEKKPKKKKRKTS